MANPQKTVAQKDLALYQSHGIPYSVLTARYINPVDACVTLSKETENSVKHLRPSEQRRVFEQTLKHPTKTPYVYFIGSKTSDLLPKIAAFTIYKAAFAMINTPYWHIIDGSSRDKIRDDESFKSYTVGSPNLIVLTGLASNSLPVKFDKCRDLLELYSHIPRIVVLQGEDPMTFNEKYLFVSVNRMMFFN